MAAFRVQDRAGRRLDEIYVYTRENWGEEQAAHYIRDLFKQFEEIAARKITWRPVLAEFGVDDSTVVMNIISFTGRGALLWRRWNRHGPLRKNAPARPLS